MNSEPTRRSFVNFGLHKIRAFWYDFTDSTNTRAKLFAKNENAADKSPALFFSRAQTAGRGTRERSFESPEGKGAYMSILFYPDLPAGAAGKITAYAAVVLCRVINSLIGAGAEIKWVNDILLGGKKLAGILTEGEIDENGNLAYAIVGMGINTARGGHSEGIEGIMAALSDVGVEIEPEKLSELVLCEFFKSLDELGGDAVLSEYRALCSTLGKEITVSCAAGKIPCTALDIDGDFSLVARTENTGETVKFTSGDVSARERT